MAHAIFNNSKMFQGLTRLCASARPICVSSVNLPMPVQPVRPPVSACRRATSCHDLPSSGSPAVIG